MNRPPPLLAADQNDIPGDQPAQDIVNSKLKDALTPGYHAEFDPAEADRAGGFAEDALSEADALASTEDLLQFSPSQ